MKNNPIVNSIKYFFSEITEQLFLTIALLVGFLIWYATRSLLLGIASALLFGGIAFILTEKVFKVGEDRKDQSDEDSKSKWLPLLFFVSILVAGGCVTYFLIHQG